MYNNTLLSGIPGYKDPRIKKVIARETHLLQSFGYNPPSGYKALWSLSSSVM